MRYFCLIFKIQTKTMKQLMALLSLTIIIIFATAPANVSGMVIKPPGITITLSSNADLNVMEMQVPAWTETGQVITNIPIVWAAYSQPGDYFLILTTFDLKEIPVKDSNLTTCLTATIKLNERYQRSVATWGFA
jgi:hypothetical protein